MTSFNALTLFPGCAINMTVMSGGYGNDVNDVIQHAVVISGMRSRRFLRNRVFFKIDLAY